MNIVRFRNDRNVKMYGFLKDNKIRAVDGDIFGIFSDTNIDIPAAKVKILAPVPHPNKIIGVGLNYKKHIKEWAESIGKKESEIKTKNPILFLKPPTTRIGNKGAIELPGISKQVEFEAELAVVIGKECRNVQTKDALKYIFGYTCANDVTARDLQKMDNQWARAKGFDSFCPLGPSITLQTGFEFQIKNTNFKIDNSERIDNPNNLNVKTILNGKVVQDFNTKDMVFKVEDLVCFISSIMTLFPGDVILTGTDVGVGKLNAGDKIEIEIEKIGKLINKVENA